MRQKPTRTRTVLVDPQPEPQIQFLRHASRCVETILDFLNRTL